MGMYTEFRVEYNLRADTPQRVLDALLWLLFPDLRNRATWTECPAHLRDTHRFWSLGRYHQIGEHYNAPTCWDRKLWPKHNSLDVEGQTWTQLDRKEDGTWFVVASSNCKNYDSQIEEFCLWINQFNIDPVPHYVGLMQHEANEDERHSLLLSNGERFYRVRQEQIK